MSDDVKWALRVSGPAARKIGNVLPEAVAAAVKVIDVAHRGDVYRR